tara:strand:- start:1725 stop:2168 length:444 start_codon:yes stop_codon:yes gene_type:complete
MSDVNNAAKRYDRYTYSESSGSSEPPHIRKREYSWWLSIFAIILIIIIMLVYDPTRKGEIHEDLALFLTIFLASFAIITILMDDKAHIWYSIRFESGNAEKVPREVRVTTTLFFSVLLGIFSTVLIKKFFKNIYKKSKNRRRSTFDF